MPWDTRSDVRYGSSSADLPHQPSPPTARPLSRRQILCTLRLPPPRTGIEPCLRVCCDTPRPRTRPLSEGDGLQCASRLLSVPRWGHVYSLIRTRTHFAPPSSMPVDLPTSPDCGGGGDQYSSINLQIPDRKGNTQTMGCMENHTQEQTMGHIIA